MENCVSLLTLQREDWQHVTVVSVMVGLYVLYLGWHMTRSSQGTDTRALQVPTGKTEWILFHWHCCLKNKQKQTNSCVSDVECLGFCPLLPISSLHAELTYKQWFQFSQWAESNLNKRYFYPHFLQLSRVALAEWIRNRSNSGSKSPDLRSTVCCSGAFMHTAHPSFSVKDVLQRWSQGNCECILAICTSSPGTSLDQTFSSEPFFATTENLTQFSS